MRLSRIATVRIEATVQAAHRPVRPYDIRTFAFSRVNRVLKRLIEAFVEPMEDT